ncbi:MAG: metallophosphoesterase [Gemmatimonadota bacterium]|nr:MAG: metallophosphoesterase [Gemmatimonadota bacterium]
MIAVISDIHGNLEALEAVLEDIRQEAADQIICLGDVVGYGADPNQCLEVIRNEAVATVLGNHDLAACDLKQADNFNEVARSAIRWTAEALTAANRTALAAHPYQFIEGDVHYVHASPDDPPAWHYILTEQEAWNAFEACEEPICFVGHSHVPLRVFLRGGRLEVIEEEVVDIRLDDRALINVGSVGQPRDGDWRASYNLFDPVTRRVVARRVEYDIDKASRKIRDAGLPEVLATRLTVGQ